MSFNYPPPEPPSGSSGENPLQWSGEPFVPYPQAPAYPPQTAPFYRPAPAYGPAPWELLQERDPLSYTAMTGYVLGTVSLVGLFAPPFTIVCPLVAIAALVFSIKGLKSTTRRDKAKAGRNMAIVSLCLLAVFIAIALLVHYVP